MSRSQDATKVYQNVIKKYSNLTKIGFLSDVVVPQEVFSTGSLGLDYKINYGGIPRGRITHIYGPERSLKTTIAMKSGLNALNTNPEYRLLFLDFERTMDTDDAVSYLKYLGYSDQQISEQILYLRDTPENCFDAVEELIGLEETAMVVIDSVGAIMSGKAYDKGFNDNQKMGLKTQLVQDFLIRVNTRNNNAAVVVINQARDNFDAGNYGPDYTYSGGRALRHIASLALDVSGWHSKEIKEATQANSLVNLKVRIDKCKIGGENAQANILYSLSKGDFDLAYDCLTIGYQVGLFANAGAWYSMYDGPNGGNGEVLHKAQGQDRFEAEITNNPELLDHVITVIKGCMAKAKTISWAQAEAEYDVENLGTEPVSED